VSSFLAEDRNGHDICANSLVVAWGDMDIHFKGKAMGLGSEEDYLRIRRLDTECTELVHREDLEVYDDFDGFLEVNARRAVKLVANASKIVLEAAATATKGFVGKKLKIDW